MTIRALTWNLFHGRDFPPDPALRTTRSLLLRSAERNETHVQVNRDLLDEFAGVLAAAEWDVALLQECPPRWAQALAKRCGASAHRVLTSRNSLATLRAMAARVNPDLIASSEGGSNVTLVRGSPITERRELVLCPGPRPERRTMAFTRLADRTCFSNLHASTGAANRARAEDELRLAAERTLEWAAGAPAVLGGDLNVRPRDSSVFRELAERFGLTGPTASDSLDHLLTTGLEVVEVARAWPPEHRELRCEGLALRLSDHAPVEAMFTRPASG